MSANISDSTQPLLAPNDPRETARDHLVVTYHYVREQDSEGVTGLTPVAFTEQIRAIKKRYHIVSAEEFHARRPMADGLAGVRSEILPHAQQILPRKSAHQDGFGQLAAKCRICS